MNQNQTKLQGIISDLQRNIREAKQKQADAMRVLESFGVSSKDYQNANFNFMTCAYIRNYLADVLSAIEDDDFKKAENLIRFHEHQQKTNGYNGFIDVLDTVAAGQQNVSVILGNIIERHLAS